MIDKCPPAETCRDAFDRTAKATIKMASSSGGFGSPVQQSRRQRRDTTNWTSAPEPSSIKPPSRHRHHQSEQPFQFDLSISDNLSSPGLSGSGDLTSPSLAKAKTFDTDTFMTQSRGLSRPSPGERTMSHDGSSAVDPSLVRSPSMPRRMGSQHSVSGGGNSFIGQQLGMQGSSDYPDAQTLEFLQTLNAAPNGDMGSIDQAQLDLGFGINWEGMHNDYADGGQQMNPFDTFFFGGQQNGNHSGGGNGPNAVGPGGQADGGNDDGGPMVM